MTNQEAIEHLKNIAIFSFQDGYTDEARKALDMAIEALQNSPTQMSGTSDLISRQDIAEYLVIKAKTSGCYGYLSAEKIAEYLRDFPSAQPERKPGKWEIYVISMLDGEGCRCSECGHEGVPDWDFCPGCGAKMEGVKVIR